MQEAADSDQILKTDKILFLFFTQLLFSILVLLIISLREIVSWCTLISWWCMTQVWRELDCCSIFVDTFIDEKCIDIFFSDIHKCHSKFAYTPGVCTCHFPPVRLKSFNFTQPAIAPREMDHWLCNDLSRKPPIPLPPDRYGSFWARLNPESPFQGV